MTGSRIAAGLLNVLRRLPLPAKIGHLTETSDHLVGRNLVSIDYPDRREKTSISGAWFRRASPQVK